MAAQILITQSNLDKAFKYVDVYFDTGNANELNTISEDYVMIGKVESLWNDFKLVVNKAYIYGADHVRESYDNICISLDSLLHTAQEKAKEIHGRLQTMLREFLKTLINGALQNMPQFLEIGNVKYPINKVNFEQKLVIGGSLKASMLEVIELTSSGEIQLSVEYSKEQF